MPISLQPALAVPGDYRLLLEFSVGDHGWFVPDAVRAQATLALQELVYLRTLRDNRPDAPATREEPDA